MAFIRPSRSLWHPDSGLQHPIGSEITPQAVYASRRTWMTQAALGTAGLAAGGLAPCSIRPMRKVPKALAA